MRSVRTECAFDPHADDRAHARDCATASPGTSGDNCLWPWQAAVAASAKEARLAGQHAQCGLDGKAAQLSAEVGLQAAQM
ncbi:MAG: hypothetical protein ACPIOQ_51005, partial [Promethearchaeia archaeon]